MKDVEEVIFSKFFFLNKINESVESREISTSLRSLSELFSSTPQYQLNGLIRKSNS